MVGHREHNLQVKIHQFVREVVPQPHFFFAVDRSRATGAHTHAREKARGLIAGTPDTLLLVPDRPAIAIELKAPGNFPTDRQSEVAGAITAAGHLSGWCSSVVGYMRLLRGFGVVLDDRADALAEQHDAVLAGAAVRRAMVPKKRPVIRKVGLRHEWGRGVAKRAAKAGISL